MLGNLLLFHRCGGAPESRCIRCSPVTQASPHGPLDGLNHDQEKIMEHNAQQAQKDKIMEQNVQPSKRPSSRRSFLRKGLAVGGAGAIGAGLLANGLSLPAFAEERGPEKEKNGDLTQGDVALLPFAAPIQILETELWRQ